MAQAKRSPILGYNHNVKYRGVVFHIQTEDSGLMNPHLFTHLFHEGVIVSTRKLVYDAGSNEESIKSLMQAQHKAVMKDLLKGVFDEKIDQYLAGTPGLEPGRGADPTKAAGRGERAKTEVEAEPASPTPEPVAAAPAPVEDALSEPIELPVKARSDSNDRTRPVEIIRDKPAPAPEPAAAEAATPPVKSRTSTAPKVSRAGIATPARPAPAPIGRAKGGGEPLLEISEDDISQRLRGPRDTAVEVPADSEAVPSSIESSDRGERAGTYSVSRKHGDAPIREKTGRVPAINPAALGLEPATARRESGSVPRAVPREQTPSQGSAAARPATPPATPPVPPVRPVTPPPVRPSVTAPIQNRSSTPAAPQPNSGVVMTRPAVVVGAPPKVTPPAQPATQRVRKAREDEGRGFGQGLISEKSLDEVILAYLSEDADDK